MSSEIHFNKSDCFLSHATVLRQGFATDGATSGRVFRKEIRHKRHFILRRKPAISFKKTMVLDYCIEARPESSQDMRDVRQRLTRLGFASRLGQGSRGWSRPSWPEAKTNIPGPDGNRIGAECFRRLSLMITFFPYSPTFGFSRCTAKERHGGGARVLDGMGKRSRSRMGRMSREGVMEVQLMERWPE